DQCEVGHERIAVGHRRRAPSRALEGDVDDGAAVPTAKPPTGLSVEPGEPLVECDLVTAEVALLVLAAAAAGAGLVASDPWHPRTQRPVEDRHVGVVGAE